MKTKILAVVGPTASGKTGLSIALAKKYNGEVISADSMQIYKGMHIATAKPTKEEMDGVKHHMIDFLEPDISYSVGQYVLDARNAINSVISRGNLPILCGGTGLYVDSLLNGIDFVENSSDKNIREELTTLANEKGAEYLLSVLSEFDPDSADRLGKEINIKRIVRAIEFYKVTGKTITEQNEESKQGGSDYDSLIIGLTAADRQYIYDRINRRVDIMLEQGLLDEAQNVLNSSLSETSSKAIGYKQLSPYFSGEQSLNECIERLKTETRRYAKRQLTWFRRNDNIHWINIDELKSLDEQTEEVARIIDKKGFING